MSDKKEYIERGALIEFVRSVRKRLPIESKDFFTRDEMLLNFQQYVELQPAVDVEPVVLGEWKEFDADMNAYSCSACNEPQMFIEGNPEQNEYSFCPHCGADMRKSAHMERRDPRAATNQVDRCTTCDNNGKLICSSCIMTGHGNDIDFYRAAAEPKGEHHD